MTRGHQIHVWLCGADTAPLSLCKQMLGDQYKLTSFKTKADLETAYKSGKNLPELVISTPVGRILENVPLNKKPPLLLLIEWGNRDSAEMINQPWVSDFIFEPFLKEELSSRIEKIVRNPQSVSLPSDIFCDPISRKVSYRGKNSTELTHREIQILTILIGHSENSIQRQDLISQVWKGVRVGRKALDVHLFNLRKKIAKLGLTVMFSPPDSFMLQRSENSSI